MHFASTSHHLLWSATVVTKLGRNICDSKAGDHAGLKDHLETVGTADGLRPAIRIMMADQNDIENAALLQG